MTTSLIDALIEADATSVIVFELLPETTIWQQATDLLNDTQQNYVYLPTLLAAVRLMLPTLTSQEAILHLLSSALNPVNPSIIYHEAQQVLLAHPTHWQIADYEAFIKQFEDSYLQTYRGPDLFTAATALEGAVLLPLLRNDVGQIYRALGLILGKFPEIAPVVNEVDELAIKAVALLGRFYDALPFNSQITQKLQVLAQQKNLSVQYEARFNLGITYLYDAFQASRSEGFFDLIAKARTEFQIVATLNTDRTDALLYASICAAYQAVLSYNPTAFANALKAVYELFSERLAYVGLLDSSEHDVLVVLLELETWMGWVEELPKAINVREPLRVLADVYAVTRQQTAGNRLGNLRGGTWNYIMFPQIQTHFADTQNLTYKLTWLLDEAELSPQERDFYQVVREEVAKIPGPKPIAASHTELILEAAKRTRSETAAIVTTTIENGGTLEEVFHILDKHLIPEDSLFLSIPPGIAQRIYSKMVDEFISKLGWSRYSSDLRELRAVVYVIAHYFVEMWCNDLNAAPFLFNESVKDAKDNYGKGQQADEKDLERHIMEKYKGDHLVVVSRQRGDIVPGRADLVFSRPNEVNFPVEVKTNKGKKSKKGKLVDSLHETYSMQAKLYAGANLGVGFLFILDLTPKKENGPDMIKDYYYVVEAPLTHGTSPICIGVFIFPANRYNPSAYSWGTIR